MMRAGRLLAAAAALAACATAPRNPWQADLAAGRGAAEAGRPAEAERRLSAAVKDSEAFPPDDPRRVEALDALASLCASQGDAPQAESLYARAARLVQSRYGDARPETAAALKRLGDARSVLGRHERALESYRASLAAAERAWPADDPRLEPPLYDVALTLEALGRGSEAEPLLQRALAVAGKRDPQSPDAAERLRDLALLYQSLGRLDDAEPLYRRMLSIEEKASAANPLALVPFLQSVASFEEARDRLRDAEALHRRAVAILESRKVAGERLKSALENFAHVLRRENRVTEADAMDRRAESLGQASGGAP